MNNLRNIIRVLMLDFALRLLQAQVDKMRGKSNPDIGRKETEICEELLDKFFKEQSC